MAYAKWRDFPKLMKLVDNLSEESKKFYHPWMFENNPGLKIRIGQFLARLSLISVIGKIIKTLYPFGYAIILKCVSEKNEIVGIITIYNFKRLSDGTFLATLSDMIKNEYQGRGYGTFQLTCMEKIAKKENIGKILAGVHVNNKRSLSLFLKRGWKIIRTIKNADEYNNKKYDMIDVVKEL